MTNKQGRGSLTSIFHLSTLNLATVGKQMEMSWIELSLARLVQTILFGNIRVTNQKLLTLKWNQYKLH